MRQRKRLPIEGAVHGQLIIDRREDEEAYDRDHLILDRCAQGKESNKAGNVDLA